MHLNVTPDKLKNKHLGTRENDYPVKSDNLFSKKIYFYTAKISDEVKKDLSCDEKSIMRSSHEFLVTEC